MEQRENAWIMWSVAQLFASLLGIFMPIIQQIFGVMASCLGIFYMLGVAPCRFLSHLHSWHRIRNQSYTSLGSWEEVWRHRQLCHRSRVKIPQAFTFSLCMLQAIKNWKCGRPGNKAIPNPSEALPSQVFQAVAKSNYRQRVDKVHILLGYHYSLVWSWTGLLNSPKKP